MQQEFDVDVGDDMAVGARVAGALPLVGATLAAVALGGVAVFSVQQAGCSDPGRYVQHDDGQVELVGSCVDPAHLPPAHDTNQQNEPVAPAMNDLTKKVDQAP
jgi:hypothetical protein